VFDGTIRDCLRGGARTPDDVTERCGAGSRCGGCRPSIEAIVDRFVDGEIGRREAAGDDASSVEPGSVAA
jgi:bacterioferritin-associated ferredoxin